MRLTSRRIWRGRLLRLAHDFVEEPAGDRVAGLAPFDAGEREREGQPLLGAGDADVAEPAFFLDIVASAFRLRWCGRMPSSRPTI